MVAFLIGLKRGFTKYPFGTAGTPQHTATGSTGHNGQFSVGRHNVKCEPLVDLQKVLFPPLHIQLDLIKQLLTALDKVSAAFNYLRHFFPKLSEAKVKAGVFVGSQIKKILECAEFPKKLSRKEKSFGQLCRSGSGLFEQSQGRKLSGTG
ncbi:uncharacterized protein LOC143255203 isoform X1 [Tachypleus tridentatus]|uniref:uncharacterized protein LOC143255203 isoform X1 n=1 Tax=Tachypleus tridentatus TaxID=6853 RepID=UPI003FD6232D